MYFVAAIAIKGNYKDTVYELLCSNRLSIFINLFYTCGIKRTSLFNPLQTLLELTEHNFKMVCMV